MENIELLKEKGYEFMGEIIPIVTTDGVGVIVGLYDTDILINRMEKHCNCTLDEDSMLQASFSAFKPDYDYDDNDDLMLIESEEFDGCLEIDDEEKELFINALKEYALELYNKPLWEYAREYRK